MGGHRAEAGPVVLPDMGERPVAAQVVGGCLCAILPTRMKRSSEIEAITRRFQGAQSDLETLRRLYSNSPDLVCVGTTDQWAHGHDDVLAVYGVENEVLDGQFNEQELFFVEAFENGDTGWSTGQVRYRTAEDNVVTQRLSLVFTLDSGVWRIVHVHTSVPVSNEELFGVELSRTLSDLLASISQESEASTFEDMGLSVATIVFTDIVGSTALAESMGDAVWTGLVTSHFESLEQIAEVQGGSMVKTLGDGAMFAFPTAASGLTAAAEMQRVVSSAATGGLQVRIGVHTGDVVHGDDYLGLTVHKAARVAAAAGGGQILASATTAGMVNPTLFDFGDPITVELKGLSGLHQVLSLHWTEQPN
jgi:adenylate cyclase